MTEQDNEWRRSMAHQRSRRAAVLHRRLPFLSKRWTIVAASFPQFATKPAASD
jgi:hypothetical protein